MELKHNIAQYRGRLDKTLASYDLTNEDALKTLVKNQMQSSSCEVEDCNDDLVEKRTKEVANFLQMLQSASMHSDDELNTRDTPQSGWKLKQDTEEYRVMYREGPKGTPFHTLLVEGYIDGPVDVCLCISWESTLYRKWWPQSTIPTFKIMSCECLQKVRIGEQISLVRMKVSWPLAAREAVIHFFEFDYFQDDLVVVLLNSISDVENIDKSTHGFSKDGIPHAQDVVRIDVVGGFAIQKVTANRSYFRTIANMDIKLDFVPPSLINFISRQLIGSGFRLYQKEVASVARGDEDFEKVLKGPMYARIREALFPVDKHEKVSQPDDSKTDVCVISEEQVEIVQADEEVIEEKVLVNSHEIETLPEPEGVLVVHHKAQSEIEEILDEHDEQTKRLEEDEKVISEPTNVIKEEYRLKDADKVSISPTVKQALETLDKVISNFREMMFDLQKSSLPGVIHEEPIGLGQKPVEESKSSENGQICTKPVVSVDVSRSQRIGRASHESRNSTSSQCSRNTGSNSYLREATNNKIVPASQEVADGFHQTAEGLVLEIAVTDKTVVNSEADDIQRNIPNKKKQRRHRFCCFHFVPEQLLSKE